MNKYKNYFKSDMSPLEIMNTYYTLLTKDMSQKEIKELDEAYYTAANSVFRQDMQNANVMR